MEYFEFGPFRMHVATESLYRTAAGRDEFVDIGHEAFETLRMLVQAGGRVVTKEQLREQVWRGATVEDDRISGSIFSLRQILDAHFTGRGAIEPAGLGYRLVVPVARVTDGPDPILAAPTAVTGTLMSAITQRAPQRDGRLLVLAAVAAAIALGVAMSLLWR